MADDKTADKTNPPAPSQTKSDAAKTPTPDKPPVDRPEPDQVRDTTAEDDIKNRDEDTVGSAKVAGPLDADMKASHHLAQKFGNDPANPKLAPHIPEDYDGPKTRLIRVTPDKPEGVVADVHPDMVGDYLRAGYSLAPS